LARVRYSIQSRTISAVTSSEDGPWGLGVFALFRATFSTRMRDANRQNLPALLAAEKRPVLPQKGWCEAPNSQSGG